MYTSLYVSNGARPHWISAAPGRFYTYLIRNCLRASTNVFKLFAGPVAPVLKKRALLRQVVDSAGHIRQEGVRFLPGTNSGVRISTGLELQVVMPVINQPFRLIFALNPSRINRTYVGPVGGLPFSIREPGRDIKFTVGKTF